MDQLQDDICTEKQQEVCLYEAQFQPAKDSRAADCALGKDIPFHCKLTNTEDIDVFVCTFTDHMEMYAVDNRFWVTKLFPLLDSLSSRMFVQPLSEECRFRQGACGATETAQH